MASTCASSSAWLIPDGNAAYEAVIRPLNRRAEPTA